jgi:translation elongation factor EF-Tu-like GTPase
MPWKLPRKASVKGKGMCISFFTVAWPCLPGGLFLTAQGITDIKPQKNFAWGGFTMPEEEVGVIVKFFAKPSVAAIEVTSGTIRKGDTLMYKGHTTEFTEEVKSMEIDNQPVDEAKVGDMIGVKVKDRVREKDKVFKVVD